MASWKLQGTKDFFWTYFALLGAVCTVVAFVTHLHPSCALSKWFCRRALDVKFDLCRRGPIRVFRRHRPNFNDDGSMRNHPKVSSNNIFLTSLICLLYCLADICTQYIYTAVVLRAPELVPQV
jgi:hypothetical protein